MWDTSYKIVRRWLLNCLLRYNKITNTNKRINKNFNKSIKDYMTMLLLRRISKFKNIGKNLMIRSIRWIWIHSR